MNSPTDSFIYGKFSRCAQLSAAETQTNNNDER